MKVTLSPQELDKETTAAALLEPTSDTDTENEQEDEDKIHDFSIALENLDDLILKLTQSQHTTQSPETKLKVNIPQMDGTDDFPKTPTKSVRNMVPKTPPRTPTTPRNRRLTINSPSRSPRTPKTVRKYASLPLISVDRSTGKSRLKNMYFFNTKRNLIICFYLQKILLTVHTLRKLYLQVHRPIEKICKSFKSNQF